MNRYRAIGVSDATLAASIHGNFPCLNCPGRRLFRVGYYSFLWLYKTIQPTSPDKPILAYRLLQKTFESD